MTSCRSLAAVLLLLLPVGCGANAPKRTPVAGTSHSAGPHHAPKTLDGCVRRGPGVRFVRISEGGISLVAAVLGSGPLGVVLSNESDLNLCRWLPFAKKIATHHHRALLFDGRGSPEDVLAAAKTLRKLGVKRTVAMGASVGAVASIRAVARGHRRLDALVSVSAERDIAGDVKPDAKRVHVPVLFVTAQFDPLAVDSTKLFYRVAPSPDKHLLMLPGALHGESLFSGPQRAKVEKTVLSFLDHLER